MIDLALDNSYTGRPQTEIGIFGILSIFWLGEFFASLSPNLSDRVLQLLTLFRPPAGTKFPSNVILFRRVCPTLCGCFSGPAHLKPPKEFFDERLWCKSLQALKSFVWINFLICKLPFRAHLIPAHLITRPRNYPLHAALLRCRVRPGQQAHLPDATVPLSSRLKIGPGYTWREEQRVSSVRKVDVKLFISVAVIITKRDIHRWSVSPVYSFIHVPAVRSSLLFVVFYILVILAMYTLVDETHLVICTQPHYPYVI